MVIQHYSESSVHAWVDRTILTTLSSQLSQSVLARQPRMWTRLGIEQAGTGWVSTWNYRVGVGGLEPSTPALLGRISPSSACR
jgi:hypothetical protein